MSVSGRPSQLPGQCSVRMAHSWLDAAVRVWANEVRSRTNAASSWPACARGWTRRKGSPGADLVSEHERIRRVKVRTGCTPPRTRGLEGSAHNHQNEMAPRRSVRQPDLHLARSQPGSAPVRPTARARQTAPQARSLAQITPPGNDERDQLKRAIQRRSIEAIPRRFRRTGQHVLRFNSHPVTQ